MGRSTWVLMLVLILSLGISPAGSPPVLAAPAWEPGFYAGWVSFSAAINTDVTWSAGGASLTGFVIEKYEGRGQLMVKVDDQGMGGASIVIPTTINLLDYGKMTFPNGTCTFSSSIVGASNYVHLRGASSAVGDTFEVPLNLVPGIRYKSTLGSSFGELKDCDQAGSKNLGAMKIAMRATTSQIQALQFQTKYNTGASVGGSCKIPGWEKTTPIPNGAGQGVRSLRQCTWRVYKTGQPGQQKGWQ
jgi:hypothetical protein